MSKLPAVVSLRCLYCKRPLRCSADIGRSCTHMDAVCMYVTVKGEL
jgi:hypothetical protein